MLSAACLLSPCLMYRDFVRQGHNSSSGISSASGGSSNSSGAVVAVGAATLRVLAGHQDSAFASAGSAGANNTTSLPESSGPPASFSVVDITGDGRCLFRSIVHCAKELGLIDFAVGMFDFNKRGEEAAADKLRVAVIAELRERRDEEIVTLSLQGEGLSFDEYIHKMSQPESWGGELEILMASYVLAWPIWVWQPGEAVDAGKLVFVASYGDEFGGEARAVHLRFSQKSSHYDALLLDHFWF